MKTILSLSALLITLTLTAQSNTATWYLNDTSGNGIQSQSSTASGSSSRALGTQTTASGNFSTALGNGAKAMADMATALGHNTTASGDDSTAMGYGTIASGLSSSAIGQRTTASGEYSTAMGYNTTASGQYATAIGFRATASESRSVAMGNNTTANGYGSTAMGIATTASGVGSTAMGGGTTASGNGTTAIGNNTTANGYVSTAMGNRSKASDRSSLVIGEYNLLGSTVTNSATVFSLENAAFVIGNGTDGDNRSDALTVLFDGTTTIAGDLSLNSDARLKANIISLGSTLAKLLQIDGKTYTMKKDENKKQKIGVLAQDIEKVFPELVSESNGVKSVNYQGLVPVLINALKEQDGKMKEQEARIERLEKLLLDS